MKVENFEELKKRLLADEDGKYLVQTISEERNFEEQKQFAAFVRQTDKSKYILEKLIRLEVPYMFNEDNTIETRENYIEGLCDHMSPYADIEIY